MLQKRQRYGGRDVHSETTGGKETGGTGEYGFGIHRPRKRIRHSSERWMGVPEAEVRMVEGTYEETKGRVVCVPGISEEFRVDVGLRKGSALSPLLIIAVMEMVSRKASTRDILRKLLYADGLAVIADREADQLMTNKVNFGVPKTTL